jgi:L-malate glycosyltransferase
MKLTSVSPKMGGVASTKDTHVGEAHAQGAAHAETVRGKVDAFTFEKIEDDRRDLIREFHKASAKSAAKEGAFVVAKPLNVAVMSLGGMGGSAHVARTAAEDLSAAGHTVHMLTSTGSFWNDAENRPDVKTHEIGVPDSPKEPDPSWIGPLTEQIVELAKTHKLDVLNVHYCAGLLEAAIAAKEQLASEGIKLGVAATLHGTDVTNWGQNPVHAAALKSQLEKCDQVSAVSHVLADQAVKAFGLEFSPTVIWNSVDRTKWNPTQWSDVRKRLAKDGEVILAHVSNLRAVKRPLDAVDTLKKVRDAGVPAKLMILGDGPMLTDVFEHADKLGVAEFIIPMGRIDPEKLPKFVAAADINLVTSENESFCLAALEASGCGVPTVGTHCGGLDEVLGKVDPGIDRTSRLLVNVGDSDGMAEQVIDLVNNKRRYQRVQRQVLGLAHKAFPRSLQAQGYLTLVDDAQAAKG